MKQLLLVRHGKAADDSPQGDFGRELKKSGVADVEQVSTQLKAKNLNIETIITSDAARAKATARIIADHLNISNTAEDHRIYEAGDNTLLKIITSIDEQYHSVMLAGHNPGFSSIATYLSGQFINLHTSGAVLLQFDFDSWQEVSASTGRIVWESES
ncbi:SixA phosphatase family protein [Mucilaginibacter ginkgonis]|uniref:Histidine phosphatase family protein n=1 Tax=Mucilaginibacter ginkgonis TaxID=2682091 RepID=A0A6I4I3G4_9SPHI|nr:histidine phosphatase family protein [Mucilaginibacter ginkgonis]QQL50708.1 histidine phosphatase family protein [Mucilaginibacter ginkgonis]